MRPLASCLSSWLGSQLGALPTYTLGLGCRVGQSTCSSWLSSTALLPLLVPSPLLVLSLVHHPILRSHLVKDIQGDVIEEASIV